MLDKLKGLMDAEENIRSIHKSVKEQKIAVDSYGKTLSSVGVQSSSMEKQFSAMCVSFEKNQKRLDKELDEFAQIKSAFKEELGDLKIVKNGLKEKLVREVTEEIRGELVVNMERLRTDVRSYNDLKISLQQITSELSTLREEMKKFSAISKHIQEADFDLTRHAKNLGNSNQEKVELLKKIDSLQRLLSKERRDGVGNNGPRNQDRRNNVPRGPLY